MIVKIGSMKFDTAKYLIKSEGHQVVVIDRETGNVFPRQKMYERDKPSVIEPPKEIGIMDLFD